ncbi:MAG: hydroxymethylbilane synthase [Proteobacteria bacterium]|nr:hydroxymethylbilane synthase [Pseudomonadota bacterium]
MKNSLIIATRSSQLALWQANWVKAQVNSLYPGISVELLLIKTTGDKILDTPLAKIGGKGLFVKELEVAILEGKADIAVHSMKDVPTELPEGLEISVITKREEPADAFVSNTFNNFSSLPQKSVVGTSSLRRVAQLQRSRPDLIFKSLRGNVNTRLRKLDEGQFDAIILAAAGLIRLEMEERITERIDFSTSLPAICQGIIGIETRKGDSNSMHLIEHLVHRETSIRAEAERGLLTRLNGGCQVPLAGFATLKGGLLELTGLVASPDGKEFIRKSKTGSLENARKIGIDLAEELLRDGGREILHSVGIEVE